MCQLLCYFWVKEEIKKEIKVNLEFNEKKDTTYSKLWDTMKAVLTRHFMALSAHIKKREKAHIKDFSADLKALEIKRIILIQRSRRMKIIKMRFEINKIETQKSIPKINETNRQLFEKIKKTEKPLSKLIKSQIHNTQMNKSRNEKEERTTETEKIQRIIRFYYKKLYAKI